MKSPCRTRIPIFSNAAAFCGERTLTASFDGPTNCNNCSTTAEPKPPVAPVTTISRLSFGMVMPFSRLLEDDAATVAGQSGIDRMRSSVEPNNRTGLPQTLRCFSIQGRPNAHAFLFSPRDRERAIEPVLNSFECATSQLLLRDRSW